MSERAGEAGPFGFYRSIRSLETDRDRYRVQRAAIGALLSRNRLHIASKTFAKGKMTAVVSVDGTRLRVGEADLRALEAGVDPDELGLEPLIEDED